MQIVDGDWGLQSDQFVSLESGHTVRGIVSLQPTGQPTKGQDYQILAKLHQTYRVPLHICGNFENLEIRWTIVSKLISADYASSLSYCDSLTVPLNFSCPSIYRALSIFPKSTSKSNLGPFDTTSNGWSDVEHWLFYCRVENISVPLISLFS